jgi:hypothetical protein
MISIHFAFYYSVLFNNIAASPPAAPQGRAWDNAIVRTLFLQWSTDVRGAFDTHEPGILNLTFMQQR